MNSIEQIKPKGNPYPQEGEYVDFVEDGYKDDPCTQSVWERFLDSRYFWFVCILLAVITFFCIAKYLVLSSEKPPVRIIDNRQLSPV